MYVKLDPSSCRQTDKLHVYLVYVCSCDAVVPCAVELTITSDDRSPNESETLTIRRLLFDRYEDFHQGISTNLEIMSH